MRLALTGLSKEGENIPWQSLPGMCCQALGGDPHQADPIAAAWLLFNSAAHIMDSVEDGDEPDPWWADTGAGSALSVATGLYFTANLVLNDLDSFLGDPVKAQQIRAGILSHFLVMCSGQHLDLIQPHPTIAQYRQIASAKSGEFFAIACWAGGRLVSDQTNVLEGLRQYGLQIGLIIQMLDDLKDLRKLSLTSNTSRSARLPRSLPIIYVMDVLPEPEKKRLIALLAEPKLAPEQELEIQELIDDNGGTLYLLSELEGSRQLAEDGLALAGIRGSHLEPLLGLLDLLYCPEPRD